MCEFIITFSLPWSLDFKFRLKYLFVPIFVKFFQISPNFDFVLK